MCENDLPFTNLKPLSPLNCLTLINNSSFYLLFNHDIDRPLDHAAAPFLFFEWSHYFWESPIKENHSDALQPGYLEEFQ